MISKFFIVAWLSIATSFAAIDTYEFKDSDKQKRFQQLTADLRCPKCQNQNIADSNAAIAQDLRQKIYNMLEKDQSDDQIVDYMVARYGDFVLYEPRFDAKNSVLWLAPLILLILGLGLVVYLSRKRSQDTDSTELILDQQQEKSLAKLLKQGKK